MTGMAASLSAMLVPINGSKARRRLATYGKTARRQISGYTQHDVTRATEASAVALEDSHTQGYGIELGSISPSISVRTMTTGSGRVFMKSPRSGSLRESQKDCHSDVGFRSIVLPPLERSDERAVIDTRGVYDVPSSGDEQSLEQDLNCTLTRKRRKTKTSTIRDDFDVVNDDTSLQRHIAAEADDEVSRASSRKMAPSGERNQGYQEIQASKAQRVSHKASIVGDHPLSIIGASRPTPITPITSTKKVAGAHGEGIQKAIPTGQGPMPELVTRRQRVPKPASPSRSKAPVLIRKSCIPQDVALLPAKPIPACSLGRAVGHAYQETAIPPVKRIARLRTPSPSRTPIAVRTTPRQRELWSMLLPERIQETSPESLEKRNLCLTPPRSATQRSLGVSTQYAKTAFDTSVGPPRTRLVDKLHRQKVAGSLLDGKPGQKTDISDTESKDSSPAVSLADDSNNVAPSLPSELKSTTLATRVELFRKPSQMLPLLPCGGPKVTYARQRSYLTESDLNEAVAFSAPMVQNPDGWNVTRRRERRSEVLVPQRNFHADDQVEEFDSGQGGAVRSIHELREAGGNARLAGEMESLMDDLVDTTGLPFAVRRRRLLAVVIKLQETTFCRRFIDHGLVHRLIAYAESSTDVVSNILLAASMLYLTAQKNSPDTCHQLIEQRTVDFLIRILDNDLDITTVAKDRRNNMSKVAEMEFLQLCGSLLEPSLWTNGPPPKVTARVLAIQCLESIVRQLREKGSTVDFLSQTAIKRMVELLVPAPLQRLPSASTSESFALRLAISTLESCTISRPAICDETAWTGETIERLTGLLPTSDILPESQGMTGSLRTLVLRLYLNITNNNPSVCEAFSTAGVIRAVLRIVTSHFHSLTIETKKDTQVLLLDNLILSLGFLINLAEWSDNARKLVLSFECDTYSPLGTLLQLFQRKLQKAAEVSAGSKRVWTVVLTSTGRV